MTESDVEWLDHIGFRVDKFDADSTQALDLPKVTVEELDEVVEEYNFSHRSEAMRHLLRMGLHAVVTNDPRTSTPTNSKPENEGPDSVELKDFVPAGKENAVDVRDELLEVIDERLLEAVQEDPDIEMEGWEVYRNEG